MMTDRPSRGHGYEIRLLHDQPVVMNDGTRLSADVYLPVSPGRWPTIYQWTPYESTRERFIEWGVWFARRGYAAVVQDVRGRYESAGTFYPYINEGADAQDSIQWAIDQPWCNGRLGTWGRSYGAVVQWQLAKAGGHEAVRCMAPHVITDEYFGDYHYLGGAFQLALSAGAALIWSTSISTITLPASAAFALNSRVLRHLPLIDLPEIALGRSLPYWQDWLTHASLDNYWESINTTALPPDAYRPPVFQQGGWFDPYTSAALRQFNREIAAGVDECQVMVGPWSHEEEYSQSLGDLTFGAESVRRVRDDELRWYDRWLRDMDSGTGGAMPLKLFVMGANRWREERTWPIPGSVSTQFFLRSSGRATSTLDDGWLSLEEGSADPPDTYWYDPQDPAPTVGGVNSLNTMMRLSGIPTNAGPVDQAQLECRSDVAVYSSASLSEDLEVTGPIEIVLYASTSGRDADWVVRVCDVYPDGRSVVISEGIVRGRYKDGFKEPVLVSPGDAAKYMFECAPTSNVFRKGHRLRVTITSSSFPRFNRNSSTGGDVAYETELMRAQQTILHDAEYPSHISLPIVECEHVGAVTGF